MSVTAPLITLDPALLARIADLELAARLIVEGARLGAHRSPFTGTGAEFQQMRPYLPGDDLKHLDWKHYARTDRLFTRVYRETTEWPVSGLRPSAARNRPARASWRQLMAMAQWWK